MKVIKAIVSEVDNTEPVLSLIKEKELSREDLILLLESLCLREYDYYETSGEVAYRKPWDRRPTLTDYSSFKESLLSISALPSGIVFEEI